MHFFLALLSIFLCLNSNVASYSHRIQNQENYFSTFPSAINASYPSPLSSKVSQCSPMHYNFTNVPFADCNTIWILNGTTYYANNTRIVESFFELPGHSKSVREISSIRPTKQCNIERESAKQSPIRQAIIIDAHSLYTSIHVFQFYYCNGVPQTLLKDQTASTPTSLKALLGSWSQILPQVLVPLMQLPMSLVYPSDYMDVPLYIQLGEDYDYLPGTLRLELWQTLYNSLSSYPFRVEQGFHAGEVSTGQRKATWTWLAANFLSNRLGYNAETRMSDDQRERSMYEDLHAAKTAGIFPYLWYLMRYYWRNLFYLDDTKTSAITTVDESNLYQAYEIRDTKLRSYQNFPLIHQYLYSLEFYGYNYTMFSHSFSQFGILNARKKIKEAIIKMTPGSLHAPMSGLPSTCFPPYYVEDIYMDEPHFRSVRLLGSYKSVNVSECMRYIGSLRNPASAKPLCLFPSCSLEGVPILDDYYQGEDILTSSLGAEILRTLFPHQTTISMPEFKKFIDQVCYHHPQNNTILNTINPHYCVDLMYLYDIFHHAFKVTSLTIAPSIQNGLVSWCLGAALELLSKDE